MTLWAILVASVNLRVAVAAVGPVIEGIRGELSLTSTEAGMLVMIPFLCMSALALVGPMLLQRQGAERIVLGGLLLIALATALRAVMPSGFLLLLMTVPIGIGIGLVGVSVPVVVKRSFGALPGRITGWYVAAMAFGAAVAGYAIVPVSEALGSWREGLAATALVALAAVPIWLRVSGSRSEIPSARGLGRPSPLDLRMGLIFAAASMGFTGTLTWVAAIYIENGWSPAAAGAVTGAIMLISIPSALLLPGLSDGRNRGLWTAGSAVVMATGILGMALFPAAAPLVWVVAFGIGNGAFFPLVLTLPLDTGPTPEAVTSGVAWTMAIGFLLGSLAPVLVGALRDLSGGFGLPMTLLAAISVAGGLIALTTRPSPEPAPSI